MKRLVLVLMISFILEFNIQLNNNNFKNFENKKHVFLIQENQKENEIIEKEAKEIVARAKRTLRRNVYEDAFELVFKIENNDLKNELLIELKQILQLIEIREKRYKMVLNIITFIWIIGLISLVIVNNRKKRKNLETIEFEVDYFRELPSELPPEKVYYLLYKKVDNRTMKSCVLELIRKKVLLIKNENNKYILEKNKNYNIKNLSYTESLLLSLVVEKIGNGCYISSENSIYKFLDFDRNNRIVTSYNNWKKNVTSNCEKENFFCKDNKYRVVLILYSLLPLIINFYKILLGIKYKLTTLLLIPSFIAFIYFLFNKKRTKKGNIEYKKWLGLKKYLSEFSNIKNRTMPEVHIWEEYLVYSTVFGISLDNELERGLIDYINVSRFQLVVQKIYILIKEIKRALNFNLDNNDKF